MLLDERFTILRNCSLLARTAVVTTTGVAAIGLSLVTVQPMAATGRPTQTSSATDDGKGLLTYSGTVVDAMSEKPVAHATVTVQLQTSKTYPWKTLSETTRETSTDGRYEFTIPQELEAYSHLYVELDVVHPDYAPDERFGMR